MTADATLLARDAANVLNAFQRVYRDAFESDPLINQELEVEVLEAGVVDGPFGAQSAVIVITPWGMNGIVLPGRGLPESMVVVGVRRPVMVLDEVPETGPYAQISLVPDVSKYTSQQQARTIAESMVPVFLDLIAPKPAEEPQA